MNIEHQELYNTLYLQISVLNNYVVQFQNKCRLVI